jgi:hypothetical protein
MIFDMGIFSYDQKYIKIVCLFVYLFIAARAIFQLSGDCHHYRWLGCKFRPMLGTQGLWAGRDLYRTTPTAIRGLGLYGLIRKTGTHVPQWDSNPRSKDHQIYAPDALTTAPRGWLKLYALQRIKRLHWICGHALLTKHTLMWVVAEV